MANICLDNSDIVLDRALQEHSLAELVEEAQEAFFSVIALKYPECESGDFTPEQTFAFDHASESAIKCWLKNNLPCMTIRSFSIPNTDTICSIRIHSEGKTEQYDIGQIVKYEVDMCGSDYGVITPEGILSIGASAKKWLENGQSLVYDWQQFIEGECNPISRKISLEELLEEQKAYKSLEAEIGKLITFSLAEVEDMNKMDKAEAFKYGIEKLKAMINKG